MCGARVSEQLAVRLYDLCEGPAEHVFLAVPYVAIPNELAKCSLSATLVVPLAWQTLGKRCFKVSQHINILEARGSSSTSGGLSTVGSAIIAVL